MAEQAALPRPDVDSSDAKRTEPSTSELISRLSEESSLLIRKELQLASAEMQHKVKHVGVGAGLFGTAGIVVLFGVGTLIATAILALALVVSGWLAALIVTVLLFTIAGVTAQVGKKQVTQATPIAPQQTVASVQRDVDTVKGSRHHDDA